MSGLLLPCRCASVAVWRLREADIGWSCVRFDQNSSLGPYIADAVDQLATAFQLLVEESDGLEVRWWNVSSPRMPILMRRRHPSIYRAQ